MPKLDWRPRFDERSRRYGVAEVLPAVLPQEPVEWEPGPVLNQGEEGACTTFAMCGRLSASPIRYLDITDSLAFDMYEDAKRVDEWPGESYSGTSVLAAAKITLQRGYITEYRWAFGVDQVKAAVLTTGPVVIGIPWYDSMYQTDANHQIHVSGQVVGGHAILVVGYHPQTDMFTLRNSWGPSWGNSGTGYISGTNLDLLLNDSGEACIPTETPLPTPGEDTEDTEQDNLPPPQATLFQRLIQRLYRVWRWWQGTTTIDNHIPAHQHFDWRRR